jgi:hypothetical protein
MVVQPPGAKTQRVRRENLKQEAITFGKYLLSGETPDEKSIALYEAAHQYKKIDVSTAEKKLFEFALKNRWAIGAIDGALAFKNPEHVIRKKLLVMSAVLECRPQYAELFIPKKRSFFYLFVFGWIGFRAICKAAFGRILLTVVA